MRDAVDVDADDTDDHALLPLAHERLEALRANLGADRVDLLARGVRLHDDDHLSCPLSGKQKRRGLAAPASAGTSHLATEQMLGGLVPARRNTSNDWSSDRGA